MLPRMARAAVPSAVVAIVLLVATGIGVALSAPASGSHSTASFIAYHGCPYDKGCTWGDAAGDARREAYTYHGFNVASIRVRMRRWSDSDLLSSKTCYDCSQRYSSKRTDVDQPDSRECAFYSTHRSVDYEGVTLIEWHAMVTKFWPC